MLHSNCRSFNCILDEDVLLMMDDKISIIHTTLDGWVHRV